MDRSQCKVLREIRRAGKYEYTTDPERKVDKIHYLAGQGYIRYEYDDESGRKFCIIKEEGRAAIYEWYRARINTRLTLGISIFAAIGGWREELALIIRAISWLWTHRA